MLDMREIVQNFKITLVALKTVAFYSSLWS